MSLSPTTMCDIPEVCEEPIELVPCANCGRTFATASLERHFNICVKTSLLSHHNRHKFDSSKQRIQGTELEVYLPPPPLKPSNRPRSRSVPGIRRGSTGSLNYELCQFCGRSFGERAIERHREWCETHMTLKQTQPVPYTAAHERMQARTKYQAPLRRSMRAKNKDKYSPGSQIRAMSPASMRSISPSPMRAMSPAPMRAISPAPVRAVTSAPKRSSLPNTSTSSRQSRPQQQQYHQQQYHQQQQRQPAPIAIRKSHEDQYDVFLSAERQLKELGLLEKCESPILSRRATVPQVGDRPPHLRQLSERPSLLVLSPSPTNQRPSLSESSPSPTNRRPSELELSPSPELHRRSKSRSPSSGSSSTELLIIEDEEDYLINKLTQEITPKASVENLLQAPLQENDTTSPIPESHFDEPFADLKKDMNMQQNDNKLEKSMDKKYVMKERENVSNGTYINTDVTTPSDAELLFLSLKEKLERPDVTKEYSQDECPLTQSLNYLDAALSLFQLDDIPVRPADAPRSRASTKRRLYSAASPLSLLTPDPAMLQPAAPAEDKCGECLTPFPLSSARFCCICGTRRSVV